MAQRCAKTVGYRQKQAREVGIAHIAAACGPFQCSASASVALLAA